MILAYESGLVQPGAPAQTDARDRPLAGGSTDGQVAHLREVYSGCMVFRRLSTHARTGAAA